jgi:hypothetical protein
VKKHEKQKCGAGCVISCERNMPQKFISYRFLIGRHDAPSIDGLFREYLQAFLYSSARTSSQPIAAGNN